MAHPGIGEIGSGIGMTALAFDKQVLFHGRQVCWWAGWVNFAQTGHGGAVVICHVGVHHVGGNAVPVHDIRVGVTAGAQ
jgi:hypothetical protein